MDDATIGYCHVGRGAACCSTSGLIADRSAVPGVTRRAFADAPGQCEGLCAATAGCEAFSHSAATGHCVMCPGCRRHRAAQHSGDYSNWRRTVWNDSFVTIAEAHHGGRRSLQREPCITPRPCAAAAPSVALLYRGETYRWGCDEVGVAKQRSVLTAYRRMLIEPLEATGHCVHIFLVMDRGCPARDGEIERWAGDRLAFSRRVHTYSQPENARSVLDLYAADGAPARYDFTAIVRYDVHLLTPWHRWGCRRLDATVMSFAAKCDRRMWNSFNCTSDLLYVIPRALFAAFSSQVGRRVGVSEGGRAEHCCFNMQCLGHGGHGCLNLLRPHLHGTRVHFCWPQAVQKVSEWNLHYLVPQCTDLPVGKAGSVWRCKLPELQGRAYNQTGGDLSMPLSLKRMRQPAAGSTRATAPAG